MTVQCDKVGLEYFGTAPVRFTASEEIAATPARVFEVFLDAESWTRWVFAITGVEWTSPFPLAVGSTRTVFMLGGMTGYEEFIAWEPGKRMAFRFNSASRGGMEAFAEDYRVTDLGEGRCRVDWVMAMTPAGASRYTMKLLHPVMAAFIRHTLRSFRRYVESNSTLAPASPS